MHIYKENGFVVKEWRVAHEGWRKKKWAKIHFHLGYGGAGRKCRGAGKR